MQRDLQAQATTAQIWTEKPAGSASGTGVSKNGFGVSGAPGIAHRASTGHVYVAWPAQTTEMGGAEIYVKRWNGTAWAELAGSASGGGISDSPDVDSQMPAIAVRESDGHVFVAWQENDAGLADIFAAEYDPVANSWQRLGADNGMVSWLALHATEPSILLMPNNGYQPVVAWQQQDYNGGTSFQAIHVRRWTGLDWVEMGEGSAGLYPDPWVGGGSEAGGINADDAVAIGGDHHTASFKPRLLPDPLGNCAVAFINGMMRDGNVEYLHGIHVRRFNGNSSLMAYEAWEEIGRSPGGDPLGDESLEARFLSVAGSATGMQLYVAADLNEVGTANFQLRCYQWTGSGWSERGLGGITSAVSPISGQIPLFTPSLKVDSAGQLIAAWTQVVGDSAEIYLRRTAPGAGGQVVWQEYGTGSASGGGVSANAGLSGFPALTVFPLGASDAYWVAWQDGASASNAVPQIYARSTGGKPAPEIVVEEPEGDDLPDGGARDFGTVLTGSSFSRTFTVRNTGSANLTGLTISKNGTHATMFAVTKAPAAPVPPGGSTTFIVRFSPTSGGGKTAALHIASNDGDESPFDINLTGDAIQAVPPVVKTTGSRDVMVTAATVLGTVNAAGSERDVFFDYGTTTAYGHTEQGTPATVDGSTTTAIEAALSGLMPHTKYNFRIRAAGALGGASGANMTFTTRNTTPEPMDDTFVFLPGATADLDVLMNDTDADNDTLSLVSFTAPTPVGSGKIIKKGNQVRFTATNAFTGASFNYTVKDGFGGSATATVTLTKGTCTIDPAVVTPDAAPITYPVQVTADGAWSAIESLAWAAVTPASGMGDGIVNVTLQGNNSKTPRTGIIFIGGQQHQITQDRVYTPVLTLPDPIPTGVVGGNYDLPIPTQNFPVTYTVTGMPAGLKMNGATGVINGRPTTAKTYKVTVKAANAAGTSNTLMFDIQILSLPAEIVGSFQGYVDGEETLNSNLASRLDFTVTAQGAVSGKITTGGKTQSFTAPLNPDPAALEVVPFAVSLPRTGMTPLQLSIDLYTDNTFLGTLEDDEMNYTLAEGWRNAWSASNKAVAYKTLHNFSIDAGVDATAPQGYGYGSFTPTDLGTLTAVGRLADNNTFTSSAFLSQTGDFIIYQGLYGGQGAYGAFMMVTPGGEPSENTVFGFGIWTKPSPTTATTDLVYGNGFGPLDLFLDGGAYPKLPPGEVVMGLPNEPDNALISFALLDGEAASAEFYQPLSLLNPSATGTTNRATFDPEANENTVTLPALNTATGAFNGQFTLAGPTTALNRTAAYQGLIVNGAGGIYGCGFFLLQELPGPGQTLAKMPKNSGRVILGAP